MEYIINISQALTSSPQQSSFIIVVVVVVRDEINKIIIPFRFRTFVMLKTYAMSFFYKYFTALDKRVCTITNMYNPIE